ncbi:MAG TPA: TOBE domain-containing protein, partial [Candidatus Aphodomonas merdavium]|nr:TOBE domain-containing protein [Candidatus Aphodomonas merdavium]
MERVQWAVEAPEGTWSLPATLKAHRFAGGVMRATLVLADGQQLIAASRMPSATENGTAVRVWWDENTAAVVTE